MLLIEKSVYFYNVFGTIYGTLMIKFRLLKGFLLLLFSGITLLNHALDLSPPLITTSSTDTTEVFQEAVIQMCSVKRVFLRISQNF